MNLLPSWISWMVKNPKKAAIPQPRPGGREDQTRRPHGAHWPNPNRPTVLRCRCSQGPKEKYCKHGNIFTDSVTNIVNNISKNDIPARHG